MRKPLVKKLRERVRRLELKIAKLEGERDAANEVIRLITPASVVDFNQPPLTTIRD